MGWDGKGVSGGAGRSAPKNEKVFICGGKEIMTNLEEELKELQEELDDALGTLASWRARANELDRLNYRLALENKALGEKIEQLERRNKNAEV